MTPSGRINTFLTLKTKLVVLFLLLALVPLAVIGAFSISTTGDLIAHMVVRQLQNVATDKAALLERWVGERRADLQVIASTSLLAGMDAAAIAPYLSAIQTHYGVYKDLTVVSAGGAVVYSSRGLPPPGPPPDWPAAPGAAPLFLSSITYLPGETESAFHIAAPIYGEGRLLGTVYGTVGTRTIVTIILQVALGRTGECYLVDGNGTFLAHKEPQRILTQNISRSESFKNIFGRRDPRKSYRDYRGVAVLGVSHKIGGTDWYIVVEQDREEAFQSLRTLKRYIVFTVLLCVCSALLITWIISWHIVRPIRRLSRSAEVLAESHWQPAAAHIDRRDEIGVLARAFEEMARKVMARRTALEQEVNVKAAELKETDITLKQIKLIAERSEKFAAIGRLGAAVAHEIRTPLTSLKLFLESVESDIAISPEYREDFTIAMGQIGRMEAAINRFLDFTKPRDLDFAPTDIAALIEDVVLMIRPMANKQEGRVRLDIAPGLPAIRADKKFLEEALVNLLVNALEALPAEGTIRVSAARDRWAGETGATKGVRIDVRDDGRGIRSEHLGRIFDPFFTTKPSGTGLGLPLVQATVKRHGGDIRVESVEGRGTLFSLFLPLETR
jgi:signal transduction histidine kinase